MHPLRWGALAAFVLGAALLAVAVAAGEAIVYVVLVVPVVQATGTLAFAAIAAVFGAFLLLFVSFALAPPEIATAAEGPSASPPPGNVPAQTLPRSRRSGGILFLGPLPIVFGSDPQVARWMIVVACVLFLLLLVFWIAVAVL